MGNKIVTEAYRKRTPPPAAPNGVTLSTKGLGQQGVSQERGAYPQQEKSRLARAFELISGGVSHQRSSACLVMTLTLDLHACLCVRVRHPIGEEPLPAQFRLPS